MKKIILYIKETARIGGIETFIYNFCVHMHNEYDITLVSKILYDEQEARLKPLIKISRDIMQYRECDTLVMLRVTDPIPENIKYQKVIRRIHTRKFYDIRTLPNDADINVCVSQSVKEDWKLDNAVVINNPSNITAKPTLLLVSATRIPAPDKGDNQARMMKLANMLNQAQIPFIWLNFSDKELKDAPANFYNMGRRLDVQNFMQKADYVVQLSSVESFGNTVLEALTLNVPLICTPVPSFKEIGVVDGVNAHVIPFDMNFDVHTLLDIPHFSFEYDNERIKKLWREQL